MVPKLDRIVTVEENNLAGGFGSYILESISDKMPTHLKKIKRIGLATNSMISMEHKMNYLISTV